MTFSQHTTHHTYTRMALTKPLPVLLACLKRILSTLGQRPVLSLKTTLRIGGGKQFLSFISLTAMSYMLRLHTLWNSWRWLVPSAYRHWTRLGALWHQWAPMPSRLLTCSRTDIRHSVVPRVIIAYHCNALTTAYATIVRCPTMLPVMLSDANLGTVVTGRRMTGETS